MEKGAWLRMLNPGERRRLSVDWFTALKLDKLTQEQYFTKEERNIMRLFAKGLPVGEVREKAKIAKRTLYEHQRNIWSKYQYAVLLYRAEKHGFMPEFDELEDAHVVEEEKEKGS